MNYKEYDTVGAFMVLVRVGIENGLFNNLLPPKGKDLEDYINSLILKNKDNPRHLEALFDYIEKEHSDQIPNFKLQLTFL